MLERVRKDLFSLSNIDEEERKLRIFHEKAREVCSGPVDWDSVPELKNFEGLKNIFNMEWIRAIESVTHADGEADFAHDIIFDVYIDNVDELMLEKVTYWRSAAERVFPEGLKKMGALTFMTPSAQRKHLNSAKPSGEKNISYFYNDISECQLAFLFWNWLDYVLEEELSAPTSDYTTKFTPAAQFYWDKIVKGDQFRAAIDVTQPIGEQGEETLTYIALDIDLGGGKLVHAYPIRNSEAKRIMRGIPIVKIPLPS